MRYLLEIYLTVWEWIQDKRGKAASRKSREKNEKKSFGTFLSQGAVGGGIGCFVLVVALVIAKPNGYNFLIVVAIVPFLAFGALWGVITGLFVGLAEQVLLKRKLNFVIRSFVVIGARNLLSIAVSYLSGESVHKTSEPVFWIAFLLGAAELPIVLMTGSRIRPGHLLVFGKGPRGPHNDLGNWLSMPTGFLLRTANLIGLLEALLAMALWISARRVDWMDFPALDDLPLIECVIIYFAVGSYLSVKTMRKSSLLRVAILLNLSTFVLIVYLQQLNSADLAFLAVLSWIMICLWAIYVFTRLIALEPVRVTNSVNNGTTRPSTPRVSHQATL